VTGRVAVTTPLSVPATAERDVRAPADLDRSKSTVSIAVSAAEVVNGFAGAVRPKLV
jgi:hypothetical protein